jgi:hypothetical protein
VGIAILHLCDEVEMIASAFACGEMTEPAVLRERHFEGVFPGGFWVNRARAVKAIAVASAFHSGGEAVMLQAPVETTQRL